MKSSLVKLNHFIPMLTDTLPYEVPFLFSNKGLYESIKKEYDIFFNAVYANKSKGQVVDDSNLTVWDYFINEYFSSPVIQPLKNEIQKLLSNGFATTIPYCYEIKKGEFDFRTISLTHPLAQIKACDLYKKHKDAILFYCGRSEFSLRFPDRVTTRLVIRHANLLNKIFKNEEEANTADIKQKVIEDHELITMAEIPNTYFVYEKYKKLHDFYESTEYLDLEKKFKHCLHFDVKRCFDSIYTHSIAWAIKGKEYSKTFLTKNKNVGIFEDEFDRLMQSSNYGETNGIPIGGEISRIFSEIIFQKIDLNVQADLEDEKLNDRRFKKKRDYEIRRYMDGVYVFTNEEAVARRIQEKYEARLKEYKLFVNESKTDFITRPFITDITSAKQKILHIMKLHLKYYNEDISTPEAKPKDKYFSKYVGYKAALNLIKDMRCIVHDYNITFYEVSNICLSVLKDDLLRKYLCLQNMTGEEVALKKTKIKSYLANLIHITFYIFSSSPRSHSCSTTFKINYIILEVLNLIKDDVISGEIRQELYAQSIKFLEHLESTNHNTLIEFLDFILFVQKLGDEYKLTEDRLLKIFKMNIGTRGIKSNISYFEMVVLMSYIKNDLGFQNIKKHILSLCESKLKHQGLKKTENFLIFFDFIKCPYLSEDEKKKVLNMVGIKNNKKDIIEFVESRSWFFDWGKQESLNLKDVLEIKEASTNY